jgi:hypothetical protein
MKKYKVNRKLTEFVCDHCGNLEKKPTSEYNRNIKLNRKNFCSRSCSFTYGKKVGKIKPKPTYNISEHSGNKKDSYTPFRYTFRCAQKRWKDFDLTLNDLKEQWELQKGICVYSKFNLELPKGTKKIHYSIRASLDRIDSSKGYVKGNIQFVSTLINLMKSNISHCETLDFINKLVKNYNSCHQED